MIHPVNHGQVFAAVEDLQPIGRQHEGNTVRPTLIARIVKTEMRPGLLTHFSHRFGRFGLENGIFIVADKLSLDAAAVWSPGEIDERSRTGWKGLKTGQPGMRPDAGEIGNE